MLEMETAGEGARAPASLLMARRWTGVVRVSWRTRRLKLRMATNKRPRKESRAEVSSFGPLKRDLILAA